VFNILLDSSDSFGSSKNGVGEQVYALLITKLTI